MMKSQTVGTRKVLCLFATLAFALLTAAGCQGNRSSPPTQAPAGTAVPPAGRLTFSGSYAANIQPIFTQHCVSCHGPSRSDNGLRLDSYDAVMKGTQHGPIVVPGSPSTSALVSVLKGTGDPSIRMPHGEQRLTEMEVQNVTLWIEAGAPK